MCGRLSQYRGIHDFVAVLSIPDALINHVGDAPLAHYNAAPTTSLAILQQHNHQVHAQNLRWGWRPHWAKDRAPPINARVEKVAHGPFFRSIWRHRLIVPVDNWFEWVDAEDHTRQPWLIRRADHGPVFCAGIGQFPTPDTQARDDDGFVIITADSEGGMLDIHDRRPVVFGAELAREWLDTATPLERAEQMLLFEGEKTEVFEWHKVDRAVGNSRNQVAGLIDEVV
ncbi:SOS response-associated peptidase [Pseudomonas sp. N40(2020)]|uniref:SOS response-associated peptidase n=1 Tax=Pseudomonas sp. N40(2020) TaxID=2767798 RepID=UPI0016573553|nr:SOS response-associated peptidase family protein [Pseudomonas sp. N40(2020)]MBC8999562.1 SOS response-associated peptidase [Pseudomonas sp. N40(2020)]